VDNRELIELLASALVEPAAGLPGAATVGIVARIESILVTYPHYVAPVTEALARIAAAAPPADALAPAPDDPNLPPRQSVASATAGSAPLADLVAALADLERDRPDLFTPLLEVVVGAWALSEPVWEALGYAGQRDLDPAAFPIPEDLFEPLLARGARWRQPPEVDR